MIVKYKGKTYHATVLGAATTHVRIRYKTDRTTEMICAEDATSRV